MIESRALRFGFRSSSTLLFDGIDWAAKPGRIEALLGPNGSGKTTLLRLLSGDLAPESGDILLNGRSLSQWSPAELAGRRAFLSQSPRLDFAFTVRAVVLMGRSPFTSQGESAEDFDIVNGLLRELDLLPMAERPFPTLSRGEKQRVQLARVLAQLAGPTRDDATPRVLFLDEPINHLDLAHQHLTLELARDQAARGHAVVVVLHDLNLALRYTEAVTVLAHGRIIERGEPVEVLSPRCLEQVFGVEGTLVERSGHRPQLIVEGPIKRPSPGS